MRGRTAVFAAAAGVLLAAVHPGESSAVTTEFIVYDSAEHFLDGSPKGVAVTRAGALRPAPDLRLFGSVDVPYIWDAAADPTGQRAYLATGDGGVVYRLTMSGLAPFRTGPSPEAISIAVGPDGSVYAGFAPDGIVLRMGPGETDAWRFDAEEAYPWDLGFGADGMLYAAYGAPAAVYRIDPATGVAERIAQPGEEHVLCLDFDTEGRLVFGTSGTGLVLRLDSGGDLRVLIDCDEEDVTAVLATADGSVWASATPGSGDDNGSGPDDSQSALDDFDYRAEVTPRRTSAGLYRITPEGEVASAWFPEDGFIFDLEETADGRVLVATGDPAALYEVHASGVAGEASLLGTGRESQFSAMARDPFGSGVFLATSGPSSLYLVTDDPSSSGIYKSEVLDASIPAHWGTILWTGDTPGGSSVEFSARAGDTGEPGVLWSDWVELGGGREIPLAVRQPSRYLQWRVTLRSDGADAPEIRQVRLSYTERNASPLIAGVVVNPRGDLFLHDEPDGSPPPLYQRLRGGVTVEYTKAQSNSSPSKPAATHWTRGIRQVEWVSGDPNGDSLVYELHYRAVDETRWKLLAEGMTRTIRTLHSVMYPDGKYVVRVTASDEPDNPQGSLTASAVSEPFLVDNTAPVFAKVDARRKGDTIRVTGRVKDALSPLYLLRREVDGLEDTDFLPEDGMLDSMSEAFEFTVEAAADEEHTIMLHAGDIAGNITAHRVLVTP